MRFSKLALATLLAVVVAPAVQAQNIVTFDNLPGAHGFIPLSYAGITWDAGTEWQYFQSTAYNTGSIFVPHSGTTVAYAQSKESIISFSTPQVFDGAWFSGYQGTEYFTLKDASNNVLFTSSSLSLTATPQFLGSGYSGRVSIVDVYSTSTNTWVLDDLTYHSAAAVPEPGSIALLIGMGLSGAGFLIRRQNTRQSA